MLKRSRKRFQKKISDLKKEIEDLKANKEMQEKMNSNSVDIY